MHTYAPAVIFVAIISLLPVQVGAETANSGQLFEQQEHEFSDSPYEQGRRAARAGMEEAMKRAQIYRAEQEALESPEVRRARERFAKGYGAADHQLVRQAIDAIDPDRELPRSARNLRAIGTVYQFHRDQGNYERAQTAARLMIMAYKQETLHYQAFVAAAARNGETDDAARTIVIAYANIPHGIDFNVQKYDNGYEVTFLDKETGKQISRELVEPRVIAAAVMYLSLDSFDEEIRVVAGLDTP